VFLDQPDVGWARAMMAAGLNGATGQIRRTLE
jgi:hypothetical protein